MAASSKLASSCIFFNVTKLSADCTSDELTPDQKDECVLKINLVNWSSIVMCFGITFLVYYLTNPAYSRSVQKQLNQVMPSNETDMESLNKDAAF